MKRKTITTSVISTALSVMLGAGCVFAAEADPAGFKVEPQQDVVSFHTELQDEALEAGAEHISEYSNMGMDEFSIPEGVVITWSYENEDQPETYVLAVSTNEDMSDAFIFEVPAQGDETSYAVQNLLLGTDYYYTISADDQVSDVYTFSTSDVTPRNLYVDGVTNVRDLGGWTTNDGKKIRQGMIIRCGQLNTEETTDPCITEEGIDTMLNTLGVKTEIDFRRTEDNEQGGITQSPLGEDVQYFSEPIGYITDITPDLDSIAETFRIFADEDNYPIIYHCKIGTDRTGLITYLLLALCDVTMDNIYTDFAFSNLGVIEGKRDPKRLDKMVNDNFEEYMGDTPQETARNFLSSIGITDEEMDAIVNIMTE